MSDDERTSCPYCGGDMREKDHDRRCDGRQGRLELGLAEATEVPRATARTEDPDTSHAAARSWTLADLTEVQTRVYGIHQAHPQGLTDEELLRLYLREWVTAESSPRKRRCDLTRLGLIVDSGLRRPLVSGRMGNVWMRTPPLATAA